MTGLPREDLGDVRAEDGPTSTPHQSTDEMLVLLYIEDNVASVEVMEAILELRPAWRLVHAGLIRTGIDAARHQPPDLILLDMHLPDGSGASALATLKADPVTAAIPVVILTAGTTGKNAATLLEAGADQFWTKPHDLGLMLDYFDQVAARA